MKAEGKECGLVIALDLALCFAYRLTIIHRHSNTRGGCVCVCVCVCVSMFRRHSTSS